MMIQKKEPNGDFGKSIFCVMGANVIIETCIYWLLVIKRKLEIIILTKLKQCLTNRGRPNFVRKKFKAFF